MAGRIEFHTGADDPQAYACRLLRKAVRSGARVLVLAPGPALAALDTLLWTFDAQGFVPHVRWPGTSAAVAARTPIWLCEGVPDAPPAALPGVAVVLDGAALAEADRFERVIEVVGADGEARSRGRSRWRHYEQQGLQPQHVPVAAGTDGERNRV